MFVFVFLAVFFSYWTQREFIIQTILKNMAERQQNQLHEFIFNSPDPTIMVSNDQDKNPFIALCNQKAKNVLNSDALKIDDNVFRQVKIDSAVNNLEESDVFLSINDILKVPEDQLKNQVFQMESLETSDTNQKRHLMQINIQQLVYNEQLCKVIMCRDVN